MNTRTHAANRRASWQWGSLVVALLGLQVVGGIVAIIVATSDESVAIVPDYHQKALQWDEVVRLRAQSAALEWTCEVDAVAESEMASGLQIRLTDRPGDPIELVEGEIQIFRHARASDLRRVRIPAGRFSGVSLSDCFDADGRWQVSIDVTDRDKNRFLYSKELNIRRTNARAEESPSAVTRSGGER